MGCKRSLSLVVTGLVVLAGTTGCIVPEDMPALREELGYASVERPDLVVKARASTQTPAIEEPVELRAETEGLSPDQLTFTWDVNGTTYEGAQVEVTFSSPGAHPVQLEASDANGTTGSDQITIEVRPNQPPSPQLRIEDREQLWADEPVVLQADGSTDPDGDELSYDWRLDGEPVEAGPVLETELAAGPHEVEVQVSDGHATRSVEESFAVDQGLHHEANLSATDEVARFGLPVGASLEEAELELSHTTSAGLETVNLTLEAADGTPVATVQTDPDPGASQAQARLVLSDLDPEPHTLVVRLERGTETMATIEGIFTYSPLRPSPG